MTEKHVLELIRALSHEKSFFSSFTEEEMKLLAPLFHRVKFPAGTVLAEEGAILRGGIHVVASGEIEIKKQTEFGRHLVLALIGRGGVLGQALQPENPWPFPVSVTARSEVELLSLEQDNLEVVLKDHPRLGNKILLEFIRVLHLRLRKLVERFAGMF